MTYGVPWSISKKTVDVSVLVWDNDSFVYDGNLKTVSIADMSGGLTPVYTGNTGTAVGNYTASVTFTADANHEVSGTVPDNNWFITDAAVTGSAAGYSGTYDGNPHGITIVVIAPSEGYEISYSLDGIHWDFDHRLTDATAGTTVHWKVSASNYATKKGTATVTIDRKPVTVAADDISKAGQTDPPYRHRNRHCRRRYNRLYDIQSRRRRRRRLYRNRCGRSSPGQLLRILRDGNLHDHFREGRHTFCRKSYLQRRSPDRSSGRDGIHSDGPPEYRCGRLSGYRNHCRGIRVEYRRFRRQDRRLVHIQEDGGRFRFGMGRRFRPVRRKP